MRLGVCSGHSVNCEPRCYLFLHFCSWIGPTSDDWEGERREQKKNRGKALNLDLAGLPPPFHPPSLSSSAIDALLLLANKNKPRYNHQNQQTKQKRQQTKLQISALCAALTSIDISFLVRMAVLRFLVVSFPFLLLQCLSKQKGDESGVSVMKCRIFPSLFNTWRYSCASYPVSFWGNGHRHEPRAWFVICTQHCMGGLICELNYV